ncbi:MAG: hypothetical protein JWR26_4485 [Pedosphaera sp.]|nr:hypothetical protein [Pedosphaera sp.]
MSTSPEADFDLEKLFLPAWAQESPSVNRYAKHPGDDRPERRFDDRQGGRRPPPRRDGPRPGGPGGGGGGQGGGGQGRPPMGDRSRGPRRDGPRPGGPGGPAGGGGGRGDFRRDDRGGRGGRSDFQERREPALPLPEINLTLMPDDKGVDSLSRQIKMSGRSFPLFDIAQMILQKPERQQVRFEVRKKPDGQPIQPLFLCAIDDTLWLSEEEAIAHVLGKHFGMFYQAEKTPTEPPKGTYTFVAQCGMSGVILGPPNYHDYQNQLRKLHAERFSRMPFDMFKARVKIVKEEEVVKKWIEEQSTKTEYVCLNVPEAARLDSREAVEKHFREVHLPNIIKSVERHTLSGPASRLLRSPGLQRLLRVAWEEQKRFPLQIATVLSQQFAGHGLQFFKVNKTITHVSVARPHYLDMEITPVSGQVKRIVELINATPKCTRRQLLVTLAPTPAAAPVAAAPVSAPATEAAAEAGAAPAAPAPAAPPAEPAPTPEQSAIIGDLHWLIHQGHVIEFANGTLETAKKPLVRPPKPPKAVVAKPATTPGAAGEVAGTEAAVGETTEAAGEVTGETGAVPEAQVEHPAPTEHAASAPAPEPQPAAEPAPAPPAEPAAT